MARQLGVDRQMIGFNGTHYSEKTPTARPTRYCPGLRCWLAAKSAMKCQRIMPGITLTSRDENNAVIASGTCGILMPPCSMRVIALWIPRFRRAPGLVTVLVRSAAGEPAESGTRSARPIRIPNCWLRSSLSAVKDRRSADGLCPGYS